MTRPTHLREGILNGLADLLRGIAHATVDANGAAYSWATTKRPTVKHYSDAAIKNPSFPIIYLGFDREATQYRGVCGDTNVRDTTAIIAIQFWAKTDRGAEAASEMLHDLELVLGRNQTLGGTCRDSRYIGNETQVGPPGDNLVGVILELEVVYGRLNNDPSTLA